MIGKELLNFLLQRVPSEEGYRLQIVKWSNFRQFQKFVTLGCTSVKYRFLDLDPTEKFELGSIDRTVSSKVMAERRFESRAGRYSSDLSFLILLA